MVILPFVWAPCVALVLLNKMFASPERAINVRIRLFPWPRIEIDAKASASSMKTAGSDVLASGPREPGGSENSMQRPDLC